MTDKTSDSPQEALYGPESAQEASDGELAGRDRDRGTQAASGDPGWTQLEARAFNAVGPAVRDAGQWLPLSARRAVANAVLAELKPELDRLERAEAELRWYANADSADAAAGSYAHRAEHAETERDRYRAAILDIDAHATPIGTAEPNDPDGNPHHYAVTVDALHRALGKVGHTAAPCTAEAAIARVRALAEEHPVGIDTALIHEALALAEQPRTTAKTPATSKEPS